MIFAEPPRTQYDLRFRLFGFPVRVSPYFWLIAVLLGVGFGRNQEVDLAQLLIWMGVMFVSIVVHELGHAFAQRHFGGHPWITLHGMGGLASCSDEDRSPRSQILISLAGPAAGFAFALVVALLLRATGHAVGLFAGRDMQHPGGSIGTLHLLPFFVGGVYWEELANVGADKLVSSLFAINIGWGLINLLPIYPLDGGQVSREVLTLRNPRRGIVLSLQVSMFAAGAMAVVGLLAWHSLFTAILFGMLAYSSYQALQAYQSRMW